MRRYSDNSQGFFYSVVGLAGDLCGFKPELISSTCSRRTHVNGQTIFCCQYCVYMLSSAGQGSLLFMFIKLYCYLCFWSIKNKVTWPPSCMSGRRGLFCSVPGNAHPILTGQFNECYCWDTSLDPNSSQDYPVEWQETMGTNWNSI